MRICIERWGDDFGVRIPCHIAYALGIEEGDEVANVTADGVVHVNFPKMNEDALALALGIEKPQKKRKRPKRFDLPPDVGTKSLDELVAIFAWRPLAFFDGKTAADLVAAGRGDELMQHVQSLVAESVAR